MPERFGNWNTTYKNFNRRADAGVWATVLGKTQSLAQQADNLDYRGRNVVERCFNKLKQWRGIAMRSDKLTRDYHTGLCLAATLHWLTSSASDTA